MSENQFGGCGFQYSFGSKVRTYIHTDIHIHIYDIYIHIYIYVRFIHWMCGVFRSLADTAHTRRHIPIGGSVAGEGGVAHRSTQQFYWVAWSRAARDGFCGRGCDVLVSMFPRSEILIEREEKKKWRRNQLPILTGT